MLPDRVSNPGLLTYESGALPIALRGPATGEFTQRHMYNSLNTRNMLRDRSLLHVTCFIDLRTKNIKRWVYTTTHVA